MTINGFRRVDYRYSRKIQTRKDWGDIEHKPKLDRKIQTRKDLRDIEHKQKLDREIQFREDLVNQVYTEIRNKTLMSSFPVPSVLSPEHWHENTRHCERCIREFSFFGGRHHCRVCGICVCHGCSSNKLPLRSPGGDLVTLRVCNDCHKSFRQSVASIILSRIQ